jgi:hypothetical protein
MTPAIETLLRSLGSTILMAVLLWASNSMNLAPVVGVSASILIASLAAAIDKGFSPNGTVAFGSVGKEL